mgnify:CR=1 FL=1|tara:strand:- start:2950 stop:3162 length:213 start_codon:yes stop_codon:yes gene_type:complete
MTECIDGPINEKFAYLIEVYLENDLYTAKDRGIDLDSVKKEIKEIVRENSFRIIEVRLYPKHPNHELEDK